MLEALDEDVGGFDWLGATVPLAMRDLVAHAEEQQRSLELLDKKQQKSGTLVVKT